MTERDCKECGESNWNKFYETESDARTEERFECGNCGKEGRKFDYGKRVIWSGGMRE